MMAHSGTPQRTSGEGFIPTRVFVVGYSYDTPEVAREVADILHKRGIGSVILSDDLWATSTPGDPDAVRKERERVQREAETCDLAIVLGGDGSFLRAVDIVRNSGIPIIGINMGHIGFLAEREVDGIWDTLDRIASGRFFIEERMTIDVTIFSNQNEPRISSWAFNEVSIEKRSHRGVMEATLAIDNRPVSQYSCDGMLVATPTGSTAYAFSAGGPVLWPEMHAMLVIPNNAHGLFTRPMVISPHSIVTVDVHGQRGGIVAYLDGTREIKVYSGDRILACAGEKPVKVIRMDDRPFADKLVRKFHLPVRGWRNVRHHGLPIKKQ